MSEPTKIVKLRPDSPEIADEIMVVQLNIRELRQIIREEIARHGRERGSLLADRWVDIDKAAKFMDVSTDWIYHNLKALPFVKKIGRKMLRFSLKGMQGWMESVGR